MSSAAPPFVPAGMPLLTPMAAPSPALSPAMVPSHVARQQEAYADTAAEQAAEAEVHRLCQLGEAQAAWDRYLQMRSLWRAAQGRRSLRPGCDFKRFNAPYQRAFSSVRAALGSAQIAALPERQWVDVPGVGRADSDGSGIPFRVLTLNVLSDYLNNLFSFQFVALPPKGGDFLPWALRSPLLIQEVVRWRPQLVALQEVDDALHGGLAEELAASAGLTALPFARRNPNPRGDGVCMFYDESLLRFVPGSCVVRHLTHGCGVGEQLGGAACLAAFDVLVAGEATGSRMVVATAHVNPAPSAKEALEAGIEPTHGNEFGTDVAMAGQLLGIMEEVSRWCGGVDVQMLLGDLNGATELGATTLSQSGLTSAYAIAGEAAMEDWRGSLVTSHNDIFHWGGELDMVLCKGPAAQVRRVLQIPRHPRLLPAPRSREHADVSLPMAGWPSDHMSLVVDLSLCERCEA